MYKLIRKLFVLAVLLIIVSASGFFWLVSSPLALKSDKLDFNIARGSSLRAAAGEIAAAGVGLDPWMLVVLGKLLRVEASIKAGSYEVGRSITARQLLNKLTRGDVTQGEIVFIEGWTFRQMRERLDAHPDLRHDTKALPESEILRLLGAQ